MSHGDIWEKHIPGRKELCELKEHEVKVLFGCFEELKEACVSGVECVKGRLVWVSLFFRVAIY